VGARLLLHLHLQRVSGDSEWKKPHERAICDEASNHCAAYRFENARRCIVSADGFFAVGKAEWARACELGLNPAVALLVMARGSGRDNSTTKWSAEAVSSHTGMSWRRAAAAIAALEASKLVTRVIDNKKKPTRKLIVPGDLGNMLWLPNSLVTGAKDEQPPLARFRQAQNSDYLQAFIDLYGVQDLTGDGGLPRELINAQYEIREHICDMGQFRIWGFTRDEKRHRYCRAYGPLERFNGRKNGDDSAWDFIQTIESMGLLEAVDYLAESESSEAELIHPLTGDKYAEDVSKSARELAENLPGNFTYQGEKFDYVLPAYPHMASVSVVSVFRLVYRPHTKRTAAWFALHYAACTRFAKIYSSMASGNLKMANAA
jgi:hypothetical protein